MVQIINMTNHPRVVLPEQVNVGREINALQFLRELCDSNGVDPNLVMKRCLLADGERIRGDTVINEGSRIYILQAPMGG